MQYTTKQLEDKAIAVLESKEMITSFEELALRMPVTRQCLYKHGIDKLDTIKSGLEAKKLKIKEHLKGKWFRSDNATLQMGLYKLLATDEEYQRLSNIKYEITNNIEKVENIETLKTEIRELVKDNGFN